MNLKAKLASFLKLPRRVPVVTEQSTLGEIEAHYPGLWTFLEKKYHLQKSKMPPTWSLATLSSKFDLPPAQIIFMEIQLDKMDSRVEQVTALEACKLIQADSQIEILDVREPWERTFGSIPNSKPLDKSLLKEIKKHRNKNTSILLYCHFGVRSLDAAHHLSEAGFLKIYVIQGGIDAWSAQVDSSIPRYSGSYC